MLEVSLDEDVFHTWEPWTQPFNTFTLLFDTAFCWSQIKPSPWTNENYKRKNKRRASRRSIISCSRTSVLGWLGAGVPLVQRRGGGGAAAFASRIHQSHLLPSASLDHSTESLGMARRLMSTMDTLFRASLLLGLLLAISGSSLNRFWMTYDPIGWTTFEFTFLWFEGTLVIQSRYHLKTLFERLHLTVLGCLLWTPRGSFSLGRWGWKPACKSPFPFCQ